ncbi:hypothetical protein TeGR_g2645 [Tetraparma gracilis]|uniref:Ammonium transporter n=1 Tax=Tetraparma gracilis TaxID=2962635 RepID=A0ABQ6N299_9STRA|nr:hypothetical protein TeGR_g2645 [Tetraparma gracilis]
MDCMAVTFDTSLASQAEAVDIFYFLFAAALVFFMQCGFAMLCAGSVREKNVKNIMLKNLLDAAGGAIGFWSLGYAFAYGGEELGTTSFIGSAGFFEAGGDTGSHHGWFFQFAFAATAATIVAGTVAERCSMIAYLMYSMMLTAFVYPVVAHAIWSVSGFLSAGNSDPLFGVGVVDFAGSGVVHLTGGVSAFWAAKVLGPRIGRFTDDKGNELDVPNEMPGHSASLQMLGTFILWTGWYGFNPGSTLGITGGVATIASLSAVTTTIAAASGCVSCLMCRFVMSDDNTWDLTAAMNGCLGGLVAITANCAVVHPWAAFIIGIIAGPVYLGGSNLLIKLKIDDTVDAVPVHMFNGMWGLIATGLFANPDLKEAAYGNRIAGLFYGDGELLGAELITILFVFGWVTAIMLPFFIFLRKAGLFRVSQMDEEIGLDISKHGGSAYVMAGPSEAALKKFEDEKPSDDNKL